MTGQLTIYMVFCIKPFKLSLINGDIMNGLLKLAIQTIEQNIFYNRVVAAPEGPGTDHKEYLPRQEVR